MEITDLPFNQLIGIEQCSEPPDALLQIPDHPRYHNHLGTLHAGALFSLAEASSGEFLARTIDIPSTEIIPVLRRSEIKYIRPAKGRVYTKGILVIPDWIAFHDVYRRRKRSIVSFVIETFDDHHHRLTRARFDWYVSKRMEIE